MKTLLRITLGAADISVNTQAIEHHILFFILSRLRPLNPMADPEIVFVIKTKLGGDVTGDTRRRSTSVGCSSIRPSRDMTKTGILA